jgi:WD40 repeat protein
VTGDSNQLIAELKGHEGPVFQIQWSHPRFHNALASCSYDRTAIVWREQNNQWSEAYRHVHDLSVNSVSWAPHDFGLILACASSDGHVSVISFRGDLSVETSTKVLAHAAGVNAVSWAASTSFVGGAAQSVKRFVSGGCDNLVSVFRLSDMGEWRKESSLQGHSDWVRDVSWSANGTIASASQVAFKKTRKTSSFFSICRIVLWVFGAKTHLPTGIGLWFSLKLCRGACLSAELERFWLFLVMTILCLCLKKDWLENGQRLAKSKQNNKLIKTNLP